MSASLLYESALVQRAFANGSSVNSYHSLTTITPSACSLYGLQSTTDFMISHWDRIGDFSPYKSNAACRTLTDLLAKHITAVLPVFHESQCLQFLGGLFTVQHGLDRVVNAATLRLHIGHAWCRGRRLECFYRDIMALVKLHPKDAAWEACRRKLHDLVEGDGGGGNLFNKQLVWEPYSHEHHPLRTDEIEVENENIRYALDGLDDFFMVERIP
ncbi:hypothetical protein IW262DRAFT_558888 [Armillaria fumosa]|nr:hypothetical protein IW262DRAFT_558888 [Armillaria fumosa]